MHIFGSYSIFIIIHYQALDLINRGRIYEPYVFIQCHLEQPYK